ncbi:hypothetical protein C0J52_17951 [Blattella germanica]|nr:hypothetical protein C0J52_17951 [Blattella germanica]
MGINEAFDWVADYVKFVDPNSWISDGSLGRYGVHLNRRGVSELRAIFSRVAASKTKEAVEMVNCSSIVNKLIDFCTGICKPGCDYRYRIMDKIGNKLSGILLTTVWGLSERAGQL